MALRPDLAIGLPLFKQPRERFDWKDVGSGKDK
jgi:hypothetical protein